MFERFIGKPVMIRTVTMIVTGVLVEVGKKELLLNDACWIADTGRFNEFLKGKKPNDAEPFPNGDVIVGRGAIIDACLIPSTHREVV